ncbi:MAG: class I tRNA ligase family protein, partial [Candidatus Paceibacteria bacterium]
MQEYDPDKIESKWQQYWEENNIFSVDEDEDKEKFYSLVEFPYPSGSGLHVGHPRSYTGMDIISRKKRMEGKNVLYPMGFDSFGLPAENYAIKVGRPPQEITDENIATFKDQLKSLGLSFDWNREVTTSEPEYYKWTQWIFLQLYKHGLAYKQNEPINWCPDCSIGLANEEVIDGKCERCDGRVEKRDVKQWMLSITDYADDLLDGLEDVDYIEQAKTQQRNWIGKSKGAKIDFQIAGLNYDLEVFTTRPDTIFGATYMVVAPEHELIEELQDKIKNWSKVEDYVRKAKTKSDLEREELQDEKTGKKLEGIEAVNPASGESIPIYVADYVLNDTGTGAIMAVPAHDERDYKFAEEKNINIKPVIAPTRVEHLKLSKLNSGWKSDLPDCVSIREVEDTELIEFKLSTTPSNLKKFNEFLKSNTEFDSKVFFGVYSYSPNKSPSDFANNIIDNEPYEKKEGKLFNSNFLDGLNVTQAQEKIIEWLEENDLGREDVNYQLNDWVFSRQRYWGEPIPLVHCESCEEKDKKALIIHGFEADGDSNWFPWMEEQLKKEGFDEVYRPTMSKNESPEIESWLEEL